jgi:trigger factor
MSENEVGVAEQEQGQEQGTEKEPEFLYPVTVEVVGPAAKRVTVEVPRERITEMLEKQYKELRQQAAIPGFRIGHAPRKLLERRFSEDVKGQVASTLVRESYEQAISKNDLQVIGDPEFDTKEAIKLPDEGSLKYSFSIEVSPDITIPDFANLKVKKPKIAVTDQNIDQAMQNLREQQGTLIPVEDRGVESGDYLTADVHVKVDEAVIGHHHDAQIVARPAQIAGLQVDDLDKQLAGAKPGESRTVTTKGPETHSNEKFRGKDVHIEIAVKDIKRLELAELNDVFLEDLGFEDLQDLRNALKEQMEEKIDSDVRQAMREQVNRFLLENTPIDLPYKMSSRQIDRVVSRRAIDLMMRGMPRAQVEANVERLRVGAADEAIRELKLFFILQKIANEMNVDVTEGELNGRVAAVAAQRDRRPEQLKQEMQKDGSLADLYVQMREQKAVDSLLESKVQIEEVEMTAKEGEAAATPASADAAGGEAAPQGESAPQ